MTDTDAQATAAQGRQLSGTAPSDHDRPDHEASTPDTPQRAPVERAGLPRFVVLGQGKAGTSLLYRALSGHPGLALSARKELNYFSSNFDKGPDWYASQFPTPEARAGRLVGEIAPSYLQPEALSRIATLLGRDIQVVFSLRRPIEQAYSRYLQKICGAQSGPPFWKRLDKLAASLERLEESIAQTHDLFGKDRVLALFFERDINPDPVVAERRITDFLGVGMAPQGSLMPDRVVNPGVMPRFLATGAQSRKIRVMGQDYLLPAKSLIFCGQTRNSKVWEAPTALVQARALREQSRWTTEVTREEYAAVQAEVVLPAARRFEARFGFDMSHWACEPRVISYAPAPPPAQFSVSGGGAKAVS